MGTAPFRGHVRAPPDNRLTSSALAGFQDQTWLGSGEPARGAQGVEPLSPTPTQRSGPSNEKERTFSATFAPTGSPSTNPAAAALAGPPAWAAKPQGWQQQHSQHAAQRLGAEQLQQEKIRGWQCCKLGCQRELSSLACGVEHSHELSVPGPLHYFGGCMREPSWQCEPRVVLYVLFKGARPPHCGSLEAPWLAGCGCRGGPWPAGPGGQQRACGGARHCLWPSLLL